MLGIVNKLFTFKSLLTTPSNVLPLHLKQTFPPIIWEFSMKVKVMRLNSDYLLKSSLLYCLKPWVIFWTKFSIMVHSAFVDLDFSHSNECELTPLDSLWHHLIQCQIFGIIVQNVGDQHLLDHCWDPRIPHRKLQFCD